MSSRSHPIHSPGQGQEGPAVPPHTMNYHPGVAHAAPVNFLHLHLPHVLQSSLPCPQRMILLILLNHADGGGRAWPSQERIASQAGLGLRAVRDHLHELEALGWISIIGHIGRNNIYRVSRPADAAGSTRQSPPDDRQEMPHSQNDNRQISPSEPADFSNQPADSAVQTGTFCRLTSQEHPNNYPLTSHKETGRPSQGGEVQEHSKNKSSSKAGSEPRPQAQPPKPPPPKARLDWREWNRQQASEANAVASSPDMPADFHAAWQGWQAYRTRRATEAPTTREAIPWTRDAAQAALRECERAANRHGWPAVIARIDQAISGNWQGINTDKIIPAPASRRSDSANRPGRYASPPPTVESIISRSQRRAVTFPTTLPPSPPVSPPAAPAPADTPEAPAEDEAVSGSAYFFSQLNLPSRNQPPISATTTAAATPRPERGPAQ